MMRRGEEEDEEGAAAATSPIFCVARNRDRETAQVFAFQELLARTLCKLQKGNFVLFCSVCLSVYLSVCLSLATLSLLLPYPHVVHRKQAADRAKSPEKGTQTKFALGIIIVVAVR
jgi:hypothetical protein